MHFNQFDHIESTSQDSIAKPADSTNQSPTHSQTIEHALNDTVNHGILAMRDRQKATVYFESLEMRNRVRSTLAQSDKWLFPHEKCTTLYDPRDNTKFHTLELKRKAGEKLLSRMHPARILNNGENIGNNPRGGIPTTDIFTAVPDQFDIARDARESSGAASMPLPKPPHELATPLANRLRRRSSSPIEYASREGGANERY